MLSLNNQKSEGKDKFTANEGDGRIYVHSETVFDKRTKT